MSKKPLLSVVIASYNSEKTIEKCLRALVNQKNTKDFEIIVVDSSSDGTAQLVEKSFPKVNLYKLSEKKFPGGARNYGISQAKGDILAFTDTDCIVDKNWIDEIIEAHKVYPEHPAIGGAIDNGNQEDYVGWGAYFCEFSQWMPKVSKSLMVEIPTCCLSVKRWAFDKYGPFLDKGYCSDTAFNWRLGNDGHKPLLIPSVKISHINISRIRKFLSKELMHGQYFAKVRVSELKFSKFQRISFIIISPVLPFLLFFRIARRVLGNRIYIKKFIRSSPLVFLGLIAWSYGEFNGYVSKQEK